jgi:hypothetical protein
MIKKAYHRLITQDNHVIDGPVVIIFDEQMHFLDFHLLVGEEPMVEWVGGTYRKPEVLQ